MAKPVKLIRVGTTLYLRIPAGFRNANKLRAGDYMIADLSQVRIIRQEQVEQLVSEEPASVVAAE
jgi:hypothetical protein